MYIILFIIMILFFVTIIFLPKRYGQQFDNWINNTLLDVYGKRQKKHEEYYCKLSNESLLYELNNLPASAVKKAAIIRSALSRMDDDQIRHRIEQLQNALHPAEKQNAQYVMKEYFKKDYINCDDSELFRILQGIEQRDRHEIMAFLDIASDRMHNQSIKLCIENLQNSQNKHVRKQARTITKNSI